ncbi:cellulose biosynthesis cyclic di-GMP-binding regulatory protein BcsB [Beijerinckia mobilis]|uniref:cellulose biosynthesis cyclic di-GMP-binding regulatory protein BcsB n=1 Tax=Beijerinckia mobilis TaxID=231434 RepID=UPI0012EBA8EE|nr:cellulose biosynthesis cyclic di-GMP-binding regulatory protein BcsB [Beijerinckia mobilis]
MPLPEALAPTVLRPVAYGADDASAAFRTLAAPVTVTRSLSLADLGFNEPIVLGSFDARREFFLPVPVGVSLIDPAIDFTGHYLRVDGGKTTLLLSVDGFPVAGRAPSVDAGAVSVFLGVDGSPRKSGFLRLGTAWSSVLEGDYCGDERAIGNNFTIDQTTRFTYSFQSTGIDTLLVAWSALPAHPVVLIGGRKLGQDAYDAAWRLVLALERLGKSPHIQPFPSVGETISLSDLSLPEPLAKLPSFAALKASGPHKIASQGELGALIVLGRIDADLAVADPSLMSAMAAALSAIEQEAVAAGAGDAFSEWRKAAASLGEAVPPQEIALRRFAARPVIAIGTQAASKASALFDVFWRQIMVARSLGVEAATLPQDHGDFVALTGLSHAPASFDVVARGEWTVNFAIGAGALQGSSPKELLIDIAAAPGASESSPVASVFLNGYLLASRRLNANGKPERLAATIPAYALAPINMLQVQIQRQPSSDRCRETPQPFPVSILPSSAIRLGPPLAGRGFLSLREQLGGEAELILPRAYLEDAPGTLGNVARIANAAGLSPSHAGLILVSGEAAAAAPQHPFLAMDVAPPQTVSSLQVVRGDGRLVIPSQPDRPLLDVSGLDRLAVIEVARSDQAAGLLFHRVGSSAPRIEKPFLLRHGDIAILTDQGVAAEFDRRDPGAVLPPQDNIPQTGVDALIQNPREWAVPVALGTGFLFLILLFAARRARRRAAEREN